jgi:hypothetical protein
MRRSMAIRPLLGSTGLRLAALVLAVASTGAAPAADLSVRLQCQQRATPGRVLCEAELEVQGGMLAWADVLILEAPPFAPPLRSRVGQKALFMKTERRQRLQMALAATEAGEGVLKVRARAVRCPDVSGRDCVPQTREAEAKVSVGPIRE